MNFHFQGKKYSPGEFQKLASESHQPAFLKPVFDFLAFWESEATHFPALTSGSTSEPKQIFISRKKIEASAQMTLSFFEFDSETEGWALCIPAQNVGGFMILARALMGNFDVLLLEPGLSPFSDFNLQLVEKRWFYSLVPPQMNAIFKSEQILAQSKNWKGILIGGAGLQGHILNEIPKLQCPVFQSFGMTETVSHFAIRKIWDPIENILESDGPYFLLPEMEMKISPSKTLMVKGKVTENEWIETHDLVSPGPDGKHSFYFVGRLDDIINSGGLKINPNELRRSWDLHFGSFGVSPVFIGLPDEYWGEKVVMVLEKSELNGIDINGCMEAWVRLMESKKLPKAVFLVDQFLQTKTLKINKPELRKLISTIEPIWKK